MTINKQIVYKKNYISLELVNEIREYFNNINDSLLHSNGPRTSEQAKLGWYGCWDRQLHYEKLDNPIHQVIKKLKADFGNFNICDSSIRYLSAPFMPHSDIKNNQWLKEHRDAGDQEGFIFVIALWWKDGYTPGTAFFNNPANLNEPLYTDMLDVLPNYSDQYQEEARNFSVKEILKWESPGDLIAWENFQWHCSCNFGNIEYNRTSWAKEFISFETWFSNK
jgi:hypothetical protein